MDIKEKKVIVDRTGVFFEAGNRGESDVNWFACHGYGQLGNNLIRKFDDFVKIGHAVVSVESLNRFYWQGVTGQVATTWMTKRFRLDEIKDNNAYLSTVYDSHKKDSKNILFGFSQGGTTIWRWIFEKQPEFDVFINYAGWMPEDIELSTLQEYLKNKTLIFTFGTNDEYLTPDRIKQFEEIVEKSGLKVIMHKTEGVHKVNRTILKDIYDMYIK